MLAEPAGEASPRDADRIMSGYWGVVAIWVTHPLCPFRVPLTVICSVILARFGGTFYKDGFGFFWGTEKSRSSSHLRTEEKEVQTRMQKLRGGERPAEDSGKCGLYTTCTLSRFIIVTWPQQSVGKLYLRNIATRKYICMLVMYAWILYLDTCNKVRFKYTSGKLF